MRYANIIYNDLVNTDSVALTFFTQGCSHHCKGCFSKNTWDFNGGKELSGDILNQLKYVIKNYKYDYLCLIGGEPLDNINSVTTVMSLFKNKSVKIWMYTGYTMEEIKNDSIKSGILEFVDILVTGRFIEEKKNLKLAYRGSSNQKIYVKNEKGEWIDKSTYYDNKNSL